MEAAAAMHRLTWCTTHCLAGLLATARGALTGSPLAEDAAFVFVLTKALKKARAAVATEQWANFEIDVPEEFAIFAPETTSVSSVDVSFVDDISIPVFAPAAEICQHGASEGARILGL